MSEHSTHSIDEKYVVELYRAAAREQEGQWVCELLGVDRPVSEREREQAMEACSPVGACSDWLIPEAGPGAGVRIANTRRALRGQAVPPF